MLHCTALHKAEVWIKPNDICVESEYTLPISHEEQDLPGIHNVGKHTSEPVQVGGACGHLKMLNRAPEELQSIQIGVLDPVVQAQDLDRPKV